MNKDELRERAYRDCIEYGTPTPGVDHRNHYKPINRAGPTLAELTRATRKAFNIQEAE